MRRLIAAAFVALGCASPGMPPGGPPDVAAPQVVAIVPDSGRTGIKPKDVVFRFDEVVSERPASVTTLADLFLISPREGAPVVSWHREEIAVRPRHGWRANTAYTVIMLRGLADIRGNVRNTGASTFFSTGASIPRTRITGNVFDWVSGSPAAGALVESFVRPDTVHTYIALVDSSGVFSLERLPAARYTLRAFMDRNKNQGFDPGEPFDTASVSLTDSLSTELVVFVHDSVPPRIKEVSLTDSLSLRVTFDKPVDPAQTLTSANFSVVGPDSIPVRIVSAGARALDTTPKPAPAPPLPAPITRGAAPQGRRNPAAADTSSRSKSVMSKAIPISEVTITLATPLRAKTAYRVRALGIKGLIGATGDSERQFTPPAPPAPTPAKPGASSTSPPPVQ
ncbi:MAG: Ig-like domain-containing protein [Gemmatimonadaceae bacterium]